jgi:hypothetical protein
VFLEEDLSTERQVPNTRTNIDDSTAAGSADEIDVIERIDAIGQEGIRRAIVGTIEDIVGIYFEAKREALGQLRVLVDAGIQVVIGGSAEQIAA